MTNEQVIASKLLFRAESHLRDQMFLASSLFAGEKRILAYQDAIRILFEAGWRV